MQITQNVRVSACQLRVSLYIECNIEWSLRYVEWSLKPSSSHLVSTCLDLYIETGACHLRVTCVSDSAHFVAFCHFLGTPDIDPRGLSFGLSQDS